MVGTLIRRPLPPVSDFIRTLLDDANATAALATLGITAGTWAPTYSDSGGPTVAATTNTANYTRIGLLVLWEIDFTITNTGGGTSYVRHTMPVTRVSPGPGAGREVNATGLSFADIGGSVYFYNNTVTNVVGYRHQASGLYYA